MDVRPELPEPPRRRALPETRTPHTVRIVTRVEWRRVGWAAAVLVALALLIAIASSVRNLTIPLLVAFIVAYLLNPIVDRLQRRLTRTQAVALVFVGILMAVGTFVSILVPRLAAEIAELPVALEQLLRDAAPVLERRFGIDLPPTLWDALLALRARLAGGLGISSEGLLRLLFGGTVSLIGSLLGLAMVPVFAFFLLRDFHLVGTRLRALLPPNRRQAVVRAVSAYDELMSGFIRGQLVVASILAVLYSTGLALVGAPLPLLVGIMSGLGNLVPYFGTLIGITLALLLSVLHWQGPTQIVLVVLVFVVVQLLEGWVITPRVIGDSVGLSPVWVLISVLAFGELLGFFGILVAVPLAAGLKLLLLVALERWRASPLYTGAG